MHPTLSASGSHDNLSSYVNSDRARRLLLVFRRNEAHITMAGAIHGGRALIFWSDTRRNRLSGFSRT